MKQATIHHPRPYWHVDAKWIVGILLVISLGIALFAFSLSRVTERDTAVQFSANVVANLFSREGLDNENDVEELRQQALRLPGNEITPLEQFPGITLTKEDLRTLSAKELKLKLFSQLTGTIYDNGLEEAAAKFTNDPDEQDNFVKQAAVLGVLTEATHDAVQTAFTLTLIISLVLLAALVFFSAGWGRLVSPGVVLLFVSLPFVPFSIAISNIPESGDTPFAALPSTILQHYQFVALLGAGLLLAALVGKSVQRLRAKKS